MISDIRLHSIWKNMKTRCNNPNYDKYQYYGGKGISVCEEWSGSFQAFREWAHSNGYAEDLTLDRIDYKGNYEPSNCKWVSRKAQANNRSSNTILELNGTKQTVSQWSEETGLSATCISQRLADGWSVERTLTECHHSTNKTRLLTWNGVTKRMAEWAEELGINYSTLQNRINLYHWPVEKALTTPARARC